MKKIVAVLVVLALSLCTVCFAETDLTGVWYADVYGMVVELYVNEDNTVSMVIGEESVGEGVWEVEGDVFYINRGLDDESTLTIGEGTLFNELEGMNFGREPIAPFVAPAVVPAADIADFNGTWNLSILYMYGMALDAEAAFAEMGDMLGMQDTTFVIENGSVIIFGVEPAQEFEFVDGMLSMAAPEGMEDFVQSIQLNDDGSIVYETMGIQFFLTAVEAVEAE